MIAYFTGVRPGEQAGHYCFLPNMLMAGIRAPLSPWGEAYHALLDWHPHRDGLRAPRLDYVNRGRPQEVEGEFVCLSVEGWTLLAAWDRSADKRGGCSASLAFDEVLAPEDALAKARGLWPAVFSRIERHLGRPVTVTACRSEDVAAPRQWRS